MADINWAEISGAEALPDVFVEAFAYWKAKRGDAWAPRLKDFHLDELPLALIPWSIVVDIPASPNDLVFRFWGSKRSALIGQELTGKTLIDINDAPMRDANLAEYEAVWSLKKPLLCETPITTADGERDVMQSLRLPLTNGGDTVAHVYSALNHRTITKFHYDYYGTEGP